MKKTRRLSFLVAMIIAITNIACIAMPVGAADADAIVSDDFESYTEVLSSNAEPTFASMEDLCDTEPWWYSVNYKTFNIKEAVTNERPLIATVVEENGNKMMRLTYHESTAGVGTNIAYPNQANQFVSGEGSYEIKFKFKTTSSIQILGVSGEMIDGSAQFFAHNILTKNDNVITMGDTEVSTPEGIQGTGINSNQWYTLKVVVNNDLRYYSVDIMNAAGTTSLQRVGGINFKDNCMGMDNIRFQAQTENSVVYIDDYSVKKIDAERLLYEDDFNLYTNFATKRAGYNIFKEVSQFRVQDANSNFIMGVSEDNKNKYLGLNAQKKDETTHYTANVMYMPWNGHILTKTSQSERGKLQLKFSFNIAAVSANDGAVPAFKVVCADNYTNVSALENDKYTMFNIRGNVGGTSFGIEKTKNFGESASYQTISKTAWYDVKMTFDLVNDRVHTEVNKRGDSAKLTIDRPTGLYNQGTAFNSIKSVMFKASEGMQIYVDDFELKYVPDTLEVSNAGADVTDYNGEKVLNGETGVNPAIASIKIPFTTPVTDASVETITLKAENSEDAFTGYTATNENGVYTMAFEQTLAPNTKYTLTVPTTVASMQGVALSSAYTYEFTTGAAADDVEMEILGIDKTSVDKFANDANVWIRTKYANTTDSKKGCMIIVAYYDANNTMLASTYATTTLAANSLNMSLRASTTVPSAELLDMSKVDRVSVYLWDSYKSITPYCESVDILKAATDSE